MGWFDLLKTKFGERQTGKDIEGGEPFDRARFNYRGTPDDAANQGGEMDASNPTQWSYDKLKYREHLGPVFGIINRTVEKHSKWALRDKKNTSKHNNWITILENYNSSVKQMILDSEAAEKDGN
tara:strand:- start:1915 stop:2286 length:372 start_codon:yes stop_codon:yes gene_type:complete